MAENWQQHGACANAPLDIFFPTGTTGLAPLQAAEAKLYCSVCPVRATCLEDALDSDERFGIRGGYNFELLGKQQRDQLRAELAPEPIEDGLISLARVVLAS